MLNNIKSKGQQPISRSMKITSATPNTARGEPKIIPKSIRAIMPKKVAAIKKNDIF